jgi:acyl-phosphate glycerol 3-phosphate acyltransferase
MSNTRYYRTLDLDAMSKLTQSKIREMHGVRTFKELIPLARDQGADLYGSQAKQIQQSLLWLGHVMNLAVEDYNRGVDESILKAKKEREAVLHAANKVKHDAAAAAAGLAAFLGHLYPIFFRFQGGKGVATALGVLVGVSPILGLAIAMTWLGVAWFFRYSSLAALLAAVLAPVFYAFAADLIWWRFNAAIFGMLCVMGILLVWRHRDNVNRLIAGTESKLGAKKS